MNTEIKPITPQAKSMLATLQSSPLYVRHFYDEQNEYIIVTMKRWWPVSTNPYALDAWHRDLLIGGYLIRYNHGQDLGGES